MNESKGEWLVYEDPECRPDESGIHRVSRLRAGEAFNDVCRMLGGRWPDAKLEQEAPVAYQFFMALLGDPDNQGGQWESIARAMHSQLGAALDIADARRVENDRLRAELSNLRASIKSA